MLFKVLFSSLLAIHKMGHYENKIDCMLLFFQNIHSFVFPKCEKCLFLKVITYYVKKNI